MDGYDGVAALLKDRVGTLVPSGTDSLGTNYITSFFDPVALVGGSNSNAFSGNYSVAPNGRTTAQLNGFTNNIVLYLTSSSTGYVLQADTGINLSGTFTAQPSQSARSEIRIEQSRDEGGGPILARSLRKGGI